MSPAEDVTPEEQEPASSAKTSVAEKMADHPHYWTIGLSVLAMIISSVSTGFTFRHMSIANDSAAATIYDRTTAAVFELDKIHVAYPELRPFFYENRELRKDDPLAPRVFAVAEMTLDTFQIVLTQIRQNPRRYPDYASDRHWIVDAFKNSKVLRDYMDAHKTWYAGEVLDLRRQAGP